MAWKKRWKGSKTRVSGDRKRYRGRGYGGRAKGILGMSMPYVAGAVFGLTNYDDSVPMELKLGAAIAPSAIVRPLGKTGGAIKAFAQGCLLGNLIQSRTGFTLGGPGGTATSVGSGSW